MKRFLLLMCAAFAVISSTKVVAQEINYNDPQFAKWGPDAATRKEMIAAANFMKDAYEAKNYDAVAKYFNQIIAVVPAASEPVYQRAISAYKMKIGRAKTKSEKLIMIDSLMLIHDLRLANFPDSPRFGEKYILDSKARDFYNYNKTDRERLRKIFRAAVKSGAALDLTLLYFQSLCDDYQADLVMADELMAEYEKLSPMFENLEGDDAELSKKFEALFAQSGAASCENLEYIFKAKLEAAPNDEKILAQASKLMHRTGCDTPFSISVDEKYYEVNPTSRAAMALAATFQNQGAYDKAVKYLSDALAAEEDLEEQEALNGRIAIVEYAAGRMPQALLAARKSLNTADGTRADNGIALFIIAQAYGNSAAKCEGISGQVGYLVAYDTMAEALKNFSADEEGYRKPATDIMNQYKQFFPTTEECFFNEIEKGSEYTVQCGAAKGVKTTIRTRD